MNDLTKKVKESWKRTMNLQPASIRKQFGTDPVKYFIKFLSASSYGYRKNDIALVVRDLKLCGISEADATQFFCENIEGNYPQSKNYVIA